MSAPPPNYPDYPYRGYPPNAYPPPGYPPMGHPPPVYGWQPNYAPRPPIRPPWVPGIIPLRPLSVSDIFNGAAVYIRTNPRATLGLTAVVVVITQLISLAAAAGPLAAASRLRSAPPDDLTGGDVGAWVASAGLSGLVGWLGGILLTGMLTVIVGRAVFGSTISAGEAWFRIRGRLPALLGLVALEAAGLVLLAGGVAVIIGVTVAAGNVPAAVLLGFPLSLIAIAAVVYLWVALTFAPVLIVLERLSVTDAITRSFALVHNSFWRVLGIRMLTWLVVTLIAGAIAVPFDFAGELVGGSGPFWSPRPSVPSVPRSAGSSPIRSGPVWWCCSTPTAGSAARPSISCCRPAPPAVRPRPARPISSGWPGRYRNVRNRRRPRRRARGGPA